MMNNVSSMIYPSGPAIKSDYSHHHRYQYPVQPECFGQTPWCNYIKKGLGVSPRQLYEHQSKTNITIFIILPFSIFLIRIFTANGMGLGVIIGVVVGCSLVIILVVVVVAVVVIKKKSGANKVEHSPRTSQAGKDILFMGTSLDQLSLSTRCINIMLIIEYHSFLVSSCALFFCNLSENLVFIFSIQLGKVSALSLMCQANMIEQSTGHHSHITQCQAPVDDVNVMSWMADTIFAQLHILQM